MRRTMHLSAIGLGAVTTLLLGSGLFALITDTANSTGNSARSGTYSAGNHDLDIAVTGPGTDGNCATATFADATSAMFSANLDLNSLQDTESGTDVCLKNAGGAAGRLTLQFTGVNDVETDCSFNEAEVDLTCGSGAGELKGVLIPVFSTGTDASDCTNPVASNWQTNETTPQLVDTSLAPGEICRLHLRMSKDPNATDSQKLAAQSDEVRWTISFVLRD